MGMMKTSSAFDGAQQQFSLNFGSPPSGPKSPATVASSAANVPPDDKIYFATLPDPATAALLVDLASEICERHELTGSPRPANLFHVRLEGVATIRRTIADKFCEAFRAPTAIAMDPFDVTFDRVQSFNGRDGKYAIVLTCREGVAPLASLRDHIRRAMEAMGQGIGCNSNFTPHVTLRYDSKRVSTSRLDRPVTWTVRDVVLIRSLKGLGQHKHVVRWPLIGVEAPATTSARKLH